MAVIFAVVGGGAIVGIIAAPGPYSDYSNHSKHSEYSDYGNYSNYSDAAERRRRRIAAKEDEVKEGTQEVNQYKINRVNDYLKNQQLISESGATVSVDAVKEDGDGRIEQDKKIKIATETRDIQQEVDDIDAAIDAIDRILKDKTQ